MPSSSNFNTEGTPISNFSIGNVRNTTSRNVNNNVNNNKFRYRVTGVFFDGIGNCTHIEYEDTFQNLSQSLLGQKSSLKAYTQSGGIQQIPRRGEYVYIYKGPAPYSAASDKSKPILINYWASVEGSLNIWNTFKKDSKDKNPVDYINLDPTVPGQVVDTQMASLNTVNYNKSLIGMVPKSI